MLKRIDDIPLVILLVGAVVLGLAPFQPEPHLWQKLKMLADGVLLQPLDIFDLCLHCLFPVLLVIRLVRMRLGSSSSSESSEET